MKKILCLIDTIGQGGAERQMIGIASFLKKKGYYVNLVTYYKDDFYLPLVENSGVNFKSLDVGNSKWSKFKAVKQHIKEVGGYDCVIAYKDGSTIIGCLLKIIGEKFKLIVSERNTNQSISLKDRIKFFLYRWADCIVPNSQSQENFIKENFSALGKKVSCITNFTDTDFFKPCQIVKKSKLLVVTAARIAAQKNVLRYMEAILRLKKDGYKSKVKFEWYGGIQKGEENYYNECIAKLHDLGIQDMLEFYPNISDVVKRYQESDIFCLPSIYEGYPNVICEAMSCGKPIVCSRVCDNPHIVHEGRNGLFFNPHDTDSMYSVLKQMIDKSTNELDEWGNESRIISEDKFSIESFVNKYIKLIEN